LTDSWLLQELVGKIESADASREQVTQHSVVHQPPYVAVLTRALDEALRVMGRNGSEVIDTILLQRYGLCREDIAAKPGEYMSAIKDLLDTGCKVIETVMLQEIQKETGIRAMTVEDAVSMLKKGYGKQEEAFRQLSVKVEFLLHEQRGHTG